jgi:hypothetical protein
MYKAKHGKSEELQAGMAAFSKTGGKELLRVTAKNLFKLQLFG